LKSTLVEAVREARSNSKGARTPQSAVQARPSIAANPSPHQSTGRKLDRVLALVDDALYELGEGNENVASDLLDEILDCYAEEGSDDND
jgi:hypothetical protein